MGFRCIVAIMKTLTWQDALTDYTAFLIAKGCTKRTIETRLNYLNRITHLGSPGEISGEALLEWAATFDWKAETRHSCYATLRGFFRYLFMTGRRNDNPGGILPTIKRNPPAPRPIPEGLYAKALKDAPEKPRLALELAGYAGLRRSEIPQVNTKDLVEDLLGLSLVVHGKGNKERLVPLTNKLAVDIQINAGRAGWAFTSQQTGSHINSEWLAKIVKPYLPKGFTLHSLRHRFATVCYQRTGDIRAVQMLLGHEDLATTQRYIQVDAATLRHVVESAT